jgi:hypothetical protein
LLRRTLVLYNIAEQKSGSTSVRPLVCFKIFYIQYYYYYYMGVQGVLIT